MIAHLSTGFNKNASREFQNRVRSEIHCKAPGPEVCPNLLDVTLTVEKYHVDGNAHPESVNGLAGNDPEACILVQVRYAQQALAPRPAGRSQPHPVRNRAIPALVDHSVFRIYLRHSGLFWSEAPQEKCAGGEALSDLAEN